MITNTADVFSTFYAILEIPYCDVETKMQAIGGIMQGHGIIWKNAGTTLIYAAPGTPPVTIAEMGLFKGSMIEYFIYCLNSKGKQWVMLNMPKLCRQCMDFTLMESGNRVNMAENNGPY